VVGLLGSEVYGRGEWWFACICMIVPEVKTEWGCTESLTR
jgi:hypothetical protein